MSVVCVRSRSRTYFSGKGTAGVRRKAGLAQVGADHLGAQDRLVEVELTVQLLHVGIEDDHELVVTQQTHLVLWTMRPRTIRGRRVFASANLAEATSAVRRQTSVDGDRDVATTGSVLGPTGRGMREQQPHQQ